MNELISIIVPFYKTEQDAFEKCIKSILAQTYNAIEIIIVDDGSGEGYTQILEVVKLLDKRISVHIRSENQGLSATRNYGLKVSSGNYIIFIDSDDVISIDLVENLYSLMLSNNADMVIGELKAISSYELARCNHNDISNHAVLSTVDSLKNMVTNNGFGSTACGRLAKKEVWLSNGDEVFPVGKLHEDLGTMWKIVMKCKTIVFAKGEYYYYYQGNSSSIHTKKASKQFCEDFYDALRIRNEYLSKEYPELNVELAFSYLMYCPLIYLFSNDSDDIEWKSKIQSDLINSFRNNYKTGLLYSGLRFKQKVKFVFFRINPRLYEVSYKLMRKSKGYRS